MTPGEFWKKWKPDIMNSIDIMHMAFGSPQLMDDMNREMRVDLRNVALWYAEQQGVRLAIPREE